MEDSTRHVSDFESQAQQASPGLVREFWDFLRLNRKWWLTPIIVVLLLVGLFLVITGTGLGPLLYTLF